MEEEEHKWGSLLLFDGMLGSFSVMKERNWQCLHWGRTCHDAAAAVESGKFLEHCGYLFIAC